MQDGGNDMYEQHSLLGPTWMSERYLRCATIVMWLPVQRLTYPFLCAMIQDHHFLCSLKLSVEYDMHCMDLSGHGSSEGRYFVRRAYKSLYDG